ncbi:hypothetical protein [Alkalihalobacillus sp. TS-13]|uniref:hypothetical protein n=1 Tax=Alkalihalobacillus sp. TS-13 TaxID=2842455 RepID=UPI001C87D7C4|nr:hypothetical protein [Alkalihalobacillus sp. TS-13]
MDDIWILLIIIFLFALPILWGIIRSNFNTNKFYGDELNKKKFNRKPEDEAYEKSSSASLGQNNNQNNP